MLLPMHRAVARALKNGAMLLQKNAAFKAEYNQLQIQNITGIEYAHKYTIHMKVL